VGVFFLNTVDTATHWSKIENFQTYILPGFITNGILQHGSVLRDKTKDELSDGKRFSTIRFAVLTPYLIQY